MTGRRQHDTVSDFNFFEPILTEKKRTRFHRRVVVYLSLLVFLIFTSLFGYSMYLILEHKSMIAYYNDYLQQDRIVKGLAEYNDRSQALKDRQDYLDLSIATDAHSVLTSKTLEFIQQSMPQTVQLIKTAVSDAGVALQAEAADKVVIAEFEHNLKQFKHFETVHVHLINYPAEDGTTRYGVTMSCIYQK